MTRSLCLLLALLALSSPVAAIETLKLVIKNHQFEPAVINISKGKKIKLEIHNQDPTPEEFESHELNREKIILGNRKATVFIGPLKPGVYPFFGEFNPKTAQGKVVVK